MHKTSLNLVIVHFTHNQQRIYPLTYKYLQITSSMSESVKLTGSAHVCQYVQSTCAKNNSVGC